MSNRSSRREGKDKDSEKGMKKIHACIVELHRHRWAVVPCVAAPLLYPPSPPAVLTPLPSLADLVPTGVTTEARNAARGDMRGLSMHEEAKLSAPSSHPSTTMPVTPWIHQTRRRVQLAARRVVAARRRERKEDEE
jgi:hypothetical protein